MTTIKAPPVSNILSYFEKTESGKYELKKDIPPEIKQKILEWQKESARAMSNGTMDEPTPF